MIVMEDGPRGLWVSEKYLNRLLQRRHCNLNSSLPASGSRDTHRQLPYLELELSDAVTHRIALNLMWSFVYNLFAILAAQA